MSASITSAAHLATLRHTPRLAAAPSITALEQAVASKTARMRAADHAAEDFKHARQPGAIGQVPLMRVAFVGQNAAEKAVKSAIQQAHVGDNAARQTTLLGRPLSASSGPRSKTGGRSPQARRAAPTAPADDRGQAVDVSA